MYEVCNCFERLSDPSEIVRTEFLEALQSILRKVPLHHLPEWDQHMRHLWTGRFWSSGPHDRYLRQLVKAPREYLVPVCGFASFHGSGYIREAAVGRLGKVRDGSELPFLLIRLNDWVEPVRKLASQLVRERLLESYAAHFVQNWSLVLRLASRSRNDHGFIVTRVRAILTTQGSRQLLRKAIEAGDTKLRRDCFQILIEEPASDRLEILSDALSHPDPLIRLLAARHLLKEATLDGLPSLVERLAKDKTPFVRREALQALIERAPEIVRLKVETWLFDQSATVRDLVQFFGRKQCCLDAREIYFRALQADPAEFRAPYALRGPGETGQASDADFAVRFLTDPRPRMRQAAIFAISRLGPDKMSSHLLAILNDPSPAVIKDAAKALAPHAALVGYDTIQSLLRNGASKAVRKTAIVLATRLGKWQSLNLLLEASGGRDKGVAKLAQSTLWRWKARYNRSFTEPQPSQIERARRALEHAKGPSISFIRVILEEWTMRQSG